jgi:hypothetical protein
VARTFNGSTDVVRGGAVFTTTEMAAGITLVAVVRPTLLAGINAWPFWVGTAANNEMAALRIQDTTTLTYRSFAGGSKTPATNLPVPVNVWSLIAGTKAGGTAAPRLHVYSYTNDTWSRSTSASTDGNPATNVTLAHIGNNTGLGGPFTGDIAACAHYGYAMTDTQLDSLPYNLTAWLDANPFGMWVLDQQATSQTIIDLSGRGGTQASIAGTTVASTSVPILGYGHPVIQAVRFTAPATPYFRQGSTATAIGSAGTCTLTIPTGVQTDDVMVISAVFKVGTATDTIQTPTGWTQLVAPVNGTGASYQTAVFCRTATSGSPGSTVTIAGGIPSAQQINAVFAAYANADPAPRSSALADNGGTASTSVAAASASTSANDLVLYAGGVRSSLSGPAGQPTFTGPGNLRAQSTAASGSQNVATFLGDDGGTSGSRTITASQASWSIAGQIILKAATVGTATTLTAQPAGTAPSGGPDTFTGATVLTVQPAGTVPAGGPDDLRAGTVSTVQPAGTAPAGGQSTFTAALGLAVTPAGTSPSGTSGTFTGGTVLTAQPPGPPRPGPR